MNHLSNNFYTMPKLANQTLTKKQLKETFLATDGNIIACGRLYDIRSKYLGVDLYKVTLEEHTK